MNEVEQHNKEVIELSVREKQVWFMNGYRRGALEWGSVMFLAGIGLITLIINLI